MTNPPSALRGPPRFVHRYAMAAGVAVLIAYGSLYPFIFHDAGSLSADLSHFLASWRQRPTSGGDALANLLLYVPLGFAMMLAFGQGMPRHVAAALTILLGAALSLSMELAQFYDTSRISVFSDFYLNVAGALGGIVLAQIAGARLLKISWPVGPGPDFARLLLLAWLGWRLYPYVPTMEIHKYWRSLEPVLFAPSARASDLIHFAALWLSVIFLFRIGVRQSMALLLLAILGFFAAKASIIGHVLSLPELLGAALAFLLSPLILGRFSSIGVPFTAGLLLLVVIAARVLPWQFTPAPTSFQWIPFFGFLHGSQQIDAVAFAQKFYLYGVVILLLVGAGVRLRVAVGLECALLFATSLLQSFMVSRSAEITDAVLALILGLVYATMRRRHHEDAELRQQGAPIAL